ncbi:Rrf2 family transcriptional regulator [Aciduricibacillus chroicocephali]|uniref:HTH-type transcriptional regulator NsrR n=1 Tax=Aciduricibacillus chroicocephali TaxID=3054939 RepID=A0ABY9KYP7_9BACI|nr:Rrf2 family transcriptional regulator [Bacillaceae bacterium 44XB]
MNLKKYTDYSLRVLIFTATKGDGELSSIKEISEVYHISSHHLGKIVFELNKLGLIETIRGRGGGIRLAKDPAEINIGMVVREMEDDFNILECFDKELNHCILSPACKLKHVLNDALKAFLAVLDQYTLADLVWNDDELRRLFGL